MITASFFPLLKLWDRCGFYACCRSFKLDIAPKNLYIFYTSSFGVFAEYRLEDNILNHYVPKHL